MRRSQLKELIKTIIKEVVGAGSSNELSAYEMMKDALGYILQKNEPVVSRTDLIARYLNRIGGQKYQKEFEKIFSDVNSLIKSGKITSIADLERFVDYKRKLLGGVNRGPIKEVWDTPEEKSYKNLGDWARDNIEQDGTYKGEPLHNYGFLYKVGEKIPLNKYQLLNAMNLWNVAKRKRNQNLSLGRPIGVSVNEMEKLSNQDGVMGAVNVEMTNPDGKYSDDMENGQAVKRLHNLKDEQTGTGAVGAVSTPFAFSKKKNVDEMTSTGAVAGYATPHAFSKKKSGSQRALDVTTKMGYKKVGDTPRV